MREHDDVQRLLRLKKYETPGEEYFENFLGDFHERQRTDILRKSSRSLFFERLSTWFSGFGREKWLVAGGVSYAVIMLTLYLQPDEPEASPIRHVSEPVGMDTYPIQPIGYDSSAYKTQSNAPRGSGKSPSSKANTVGSPFLSLDELKFPLESGTFREF